MTDVEFVYAEGLAMGDAVRNPAIEKAAVAAQRLAKGQPALRVAA